MGSILIGGSSFVGALQRMDKMESKPIREFTLEVFDSVAKADEANILKNRRLTGVERVRLLTAIVGVSDGRSKSGFSGSYRIIHVLRR